MDNSLSKVKRILYAGSLPACWLALRLAPGTRDGLPGILREWNGIRTEPFRLQWCRQSLPVLLAALGILWFAALLIVSQEDRKRPGEEHGSARWADPREIRKKYAGPPGTSGKILTAHVSMALDDRLHRRNLNTIIVGGSGSGKTRSYVMGNILEAHAISLFILDPKSESLRLTGNLLRKRGYRIRVLDLITPDKSHCYNPLWYIRSDDDVQKLVTNLFVSTEPKDKKGGDPFWDISARMLLCALIYYLHYEEPREQQNFSRVLELLQEGAMKDENAKEPTPLDERFSSLRIRQPDHIAVKYYDAYHSGAARTLMSIQISLAVRLEKFHVQSLAALTRTDELELDRMGEEKTALFAVIPDNDTSYNFLVSILYTQLFQQLFELADRKYGGRLPVPVHILQDEFANVCLPSDYDKILSVMRSRGIFVSIVLQNMAQLKALYEKEWESIAGNCDTFLFMGGNELQTHEYVSKLLGKQTVEVKSESTGKNGTSVNRSLIQRALLLPGEVRALPERDALLFIRGEAPVRDRKYDLKKHPAIRETPEGGAEPYDHGETPSCEGLIRFTGERTDAPRAPYYETTLRLYTSEELEKEFGLKNKKA